MKDSRFDASRTGASKAPPIPLFNPAHGSEEIKMPYRMQSCIIAKNVSQGPKAKTEENRDKPDQAVICRGSAR